MHLDTSIYGLTVPLLTTSRGRKLGKSFSSSGDPFWLSPTRTSPFHFYQNLVRTADEDVGLMLKRLTFIPVKEVEELVR